MTINGVPNRNCGVFADPAVMVGDKPLRCSKHDDNLDLHKMDGVRFVNRKAKQTTEAHLE